MKIFDTTGGKRELQSTKIEWQEVEEPAETKKIYVPYKNYDDIEPNPKYTQFQEDKKQAIILAEI